jgi:hypothetical protein
MTFVKEAEPAPINENYKNYAGIINEVLQFGFNDGPQVNRKRIEAWINEAQFQIAREVEAPEFQELENLQLQQGTYKYPLPSRFLRIQDIYYPEIVTRLRPMDLQQFDVAGKGKFEGPPEMYTLYKNELWLFPTPNNGTDILEIHYILNPPALVNETDIPVLNPNYWHLLVQYAVCRAFEAEDDPESAQAHMGRYKTDLAAYATDVQFRIIDRPHQVDGSWQGSTYGSRGVL